jgi:methionine-rich copper-binding protein CopC
MKYSEDNGETWTTTIPQGTKAISYHPQWKVFGDSNHNDTTQEIIDVTIAKVTPTVTAPTLVENLVYNSTSQALLNAGSTNFGTLQYSRNNETFSTSIPTEINAGSYDMWYRVLGDSNINDVAAVKLTNTISKATAAYTAPTPANDLVYNGLSQALLNEGSTPDGTMQYSSDNNAWSTEVPTAINAGTYTSYWRIIGDSNHNDKASASISTTIDKAAGEMSAPVAIGGLVYNGNT